MISILIPAYNESKSLPLIVKQLEDLFNEEATLNKYDYEILVVNDGSRDNTAEVLSRLRKEHPTLNYINLSRNFGKENALLAGFDYVKGSAVIIMDADLQHPVSSIPEMIALWEQGYEDVYGKRITRGKEPWLRKQLTSLYYSVLQHSTRITVLPNVGDFRLLDRRCIDAIRNMRETQRYTKGLYCWIGYKKAPFYFKQEDRVVGKSSFNFHSLLNLAIEGILCFTTTPLRFATIMGCVVSLCTFIYLALVLFKTLLYGESVQGYPTIICVILFLGGCQLLALGIIGEYIGRIYQESKGRPAYIVDTYNEEKI